MKRIFISIVLSLTLVGVTRAQPLPRALSVPGGIAIVRLAPSTAPMPQAFFENNRVLVAEHKSHWQAIVGLPLTAEPGVHQLTTIGPDSSRQEHVFTIQAKEYDTQRITLKNRRMVEPTASDLKRIEREQVAIRAAFAQWSEDPVPALRFDTPASGSLTGTFGTRRFFNDEPRQPHSGIDIGAPAGTPVYAPAAGIVTLIGDYFFNGRTLFIDHGQGLVTMYNHLRKVSVANGARVLRGQRIGEIGMTGRATGPHLHLSVSLNNNRVDPLLFFSEETLTQWGAIAQTAH